MKQHWFSMKEAMNEIYLWKIELIWSFSFQRHHSCLPKHPGRGRIWSIFIFFSLIYLSCSLHLVFFSVWWIFLWIDSDLETLQWKQFTLFCFHRLKIKLLSDFLFQLLANQKYSYLNRIQINFPQFNIYVYLKCRPYRLQSLNFDCSSLLSAP